MTNLEGLKLKELPENSTCCGFGRTFILKFVPIPPALSQQKGHNALSTEAEIIFSSKASCLIKIESYIKKNKHLTNTMHFADGLINF